MKIMVFLFFTGSCLMSGAQPISVFMREGRSIIITGSDRGLFRVTPYGNHIVRVQATRVDEDFFKDDRYEMVETHEWPGKFGVKSEGNAFRLATEARDGITMLFNKTSNEFSFYKTGDRSAFLNHSRIAWDADTIRNIFSYDPNEHFSGLGHGYFAREESIDLKGKSIQRNYGIEHGQQAPLIVPYYLSNKGYGIFLNSTFPNNFVFGKNGKYEFSIYGDGRMDFFVILGPNFSDILNRYTQLTGRPRLPPRSFFGLALSDKGHDHNSTDPSDENWWKRRITLHRDAGYPLDHIVNDNRWRAGGGQRCISHFEWDKSRYPDPSEYAGWVKTNGLISTLDLNRCIAARSDGWKPSFNIPKPEGIDFNTSAPDLTKKEVRDWFWNLMWRKSLDPKLKYPGDALWIDEFDEMGKAPASMLFENGQTWMEMRNYWFFLIAKSLVQQGWDRSFNGIKRPFVWVRGMTAGAQRYATLWSGDIKPTYEDMKTQVRGMQLAGLSGFPFWGHDAGGFYDYDKKRGPTDSMYMQWSMAFGSFTPFWKPHGVGQSRWPADRSSEVQQDAKWYSELRYKMMPYIYTYARISSFSGMPLTRAMIIDHQHDPMAWKHDLQYMWGNEILVAPNCSETDTTVSVWLPKGEWYDFRSENKLSGNKIINYPSPLGKLPLFVKAGAIIPMAPFALSTAFISKDTLTLHVYTGADGKFTLYDDDGVTESYKMKNESRTTAIAFNQSGISLIIAPAVGSYVGASTHKVYQIDFHGLAGMECFEVNGRKVDAVWDGERKIISVKLGRLPVAVGVRVRRCQMSGRHQTSFKDVTCSSPPLTPPSKYNFSAEPLDPP